MFPDKFEYYAPKSIEEAADLLLKITDFVDDDNGSTKFKEKLLRYLYDTFYFFLMVFRFQKFTNRS